MYSFIRLQKISTPHHRHFKKKRVSEKDTEESLSWLRFQASSLHYWFSGMKVALRRG